MEDFCNQELRLPLQWIYQTKLQLTDDDLFEKPDSDYPYNRLGYCETIIETWYYSFTRLMFYFEDLDLDCDKGHLEFYVGEYSDDRIKGKNVYLGIVQYKKQHFNIFVFYRKNTISQLYITFQLPNSIGDLILCVQVCVILVFVCF
jgi:hypothetical protein